MPTERSEGAHVFRVDCHREVAGNGWDEPCKSRGLRTVLWAAGGEIPPADPAVVRTSPGLPLCSLIDLWPFSSTSSPTCRHRLSRDPLPGIPHLATGYLCPAGSIICATAPRWGRRRPLELNVTMPSLVLCSQIPSISTSVPVRVVPLLNVTAAEQSAGRPP